MLFPLETSIPTLTITNLPELICSCFHPHSLQLILVRYTGVIPNLLKRAHIIRGWLTVFITDATIQKKPRQTNCIPYYIKQVQLQRLLSANYTFMVLKIVQHRIPPHSDHLRFGMQAAEPKINQ